MREGNAPVRGGWIEFLPTDGTVGVNRSAPIGKDGRFEAVGVAVGVNRIGLSGITVNHPRMRRLLDPLSSRTYRTIPATPHGELNIDLIEESAR